MSGRTRLTQEQKQAAGTYRPTRAKPRFIGIPVGPDCSPPPELNPDEQRCWRQLFEQYYKLGIIDEVNLPALNLLAIVNARLEAQAAAGEMSVSDASAFLAMLSGFGGAPKKRGNYRPFAKGANSGA